MPNDRRRRSRERRMEKAMSESTLIVTGAAGPPRAQRPQGQEDGAAHSQCPACGFGTLRHDRFCRRCGINLDQWRSASTVPPNVNASVERENAEHPVAGQILTTTRLVTGQNMTTSEHRFDLVVIGSGPAGQKGAIAPTSFALAGERGLKQLSYLEEGRQTGVAG